MPTHSSPALDDVRKTPAPAIAIRIPLRLVGMAVLVGVALVMLALASWSVDDPSFSYATSKAPANWLGYPGAALADLIFQLFGIAIFPILVPPAIWAWKLIGRAPRPASACALPPGSAPAF